MEIRPRSPRQLFWLLQIGGWLLVMPVSAGVALFLFPDPGTVFLFSVIRQMLGFSLSLGLWQLYRRWPAAGFRLSPHLWQIALACLLAAALDALLTRACQLTLELPALPVLVERGSLFSRLAVYIAWSALYFAIRQELEKRDTELRLARAEAANREAELLHLRAQVNPHFLLNALNTLIGYAETDPGAVVRTTHAIADYLRYSLSHGAHRAPLGQELDALAGYLTIVEAQHQRHGLRWTIDPSAEARLALAPTALVQPLVENAIKYGLHSSPPPLRLHVSARVEANFLFVAIENSGRWIEPDSANKPVPSTGVGLNSVRRRLTLLCGDQATLTVTTPPGLVRLEVRVPFETAPARA